MKKFFTEQYEIMMRWYQMLRKTFCDDIPVGFEKELTYMNYVYFKTQYGIDLFENLASLPALQSEIQLFLRNRSYCKDRYKRESKGNGCDKKKLENSFTFEQMR